MLSLVNIYCLSTFVLNHTRSDDPNRITKKIKFMKEIVFLCISTSLNNIYSAKKFLVFCYVSIMIYHQRPTMHAENILYIYLSAYIADV